MLAECPSVLHGRWPRSRKREPGRGRSCAAGARSRFQEGRRALFAPLPHCTRFEEATCRDDECHDQKRFRSRRIDGCCSDFAGGVGLGAQARPDSAGQAGWAGRAGAAPGRLRSRARRQQGRQEHRGSARAHRLRLHRRCLRGLCALVPPGDAAHQREGGPRTIDARTTSFEAGDGQSYRFKTESSADGAAAEIVDGTASKSAATAMRSS